MSLDGRWVVGPRASVLWYGVGRRGPVDRDALLLLRSPPLLRMPRPNPLCAAFLLASSLVACGSPKDQAVGSPARPAFGHLSADTGLHYADVTRQAGIDFVHSIGDGELSNLVESTGGGAGFLDYDQDGNLDLYAVSGTFHPELSDGAKLRERYGNRLFRNRGDGTFVDVTEPARVGDAGYGMGGAVGDYDNDGLLDLYVGNYVQFDPQYRLYFAPDGFPGPLAYPGQPDVLYRNRGDGTFEDVTERVGVLRPDGRAMGIGAADYDADGYVDIFVANDQTENYLFHNIRGERFEEAAVAARVAFNHRGDATSAMTVTFGDYDGDGQLDMFVPDMSYGALYRNEGAGVFTDLTYPSGVAVVSGQFVGWAAAFVDHDNDGDLDIFQVNGDDHHLYGQEALLFDNTGGGTFRDVSTTRGGYFQRELVSRGAAFGDYDNDGDVDVFIVNLNDRAVLLRNEGGNRNSWLLIQLVGQRSNRDGVGARLTIRAGDLSRITQRTSATTYLSTNDPRLHVGLGARERVDRIEVVWPSGVVQIVEDLAARQVLTIREPAR